MALNKYMHPRNIYKSPPNFEKLSKGYEEFGKIAKTDVTGKVSINFKDPNALRVLTKYLLKSDFKLDVDIPEDRLVPTLPLRLNYILWLEDLMNGIEKTTEVRGIDIGTGACAVYPLLAAVKNKWQMLGTEADSMSLQKAHENVNRNNLQTLIQLKNSQESTLIQHLFTEDDGIIFDFCMCNPPFYSNMQELYESRSPARLPPKNGFTGSPQELITEGGELEFCRKLIKESINCKNKVLIFTTMIGHKYHVSELQQDLKALNIKHTHTEFCQGRVTRWGLAWTFQDYDIYKLVPPRDKSRKKTVPILFKLTETPDCEYNLDAVFNKIKNVLNTLDIEQKIINKRGTTICLDLKAKVNTWSNQRKRRRFMQRSETETKKIKLENGDNSNKSGENGKRSNKSGKNEEYSNNSGDNRADETETKKINLKNGEGSNSNKSGETGESSNKNENNEEYSYKSGDTNKIKLENGEGSNKNGETIESSNKSGKNEENSNKSEADETETNKIKLENGEGSNKNGETEESFDKSGKNEEYCNKGGNSTADETETNKIKLENEDKSEEKANSPSKSTKLQETTEFDKNNSNILEKQSLDETEQMADKDPLVQAFLKLFKKEEAIFLEMECVGGSGGKESLHQIMQYIKNNWK